MAIKLKFPKFIENMELIRVAMNLTAPSAPKEPRRNPSRILKDKKYKVLVEKRNDYVSRVIDFMEFKEMEKNSKDIRTVEDHECSYCGEMMKMDNENKNEFFDRVGWMHSQCHYYKTLESKGLKTPLEIEKEEKRKQKNFNLNKNYFKKQLKDNLLKQQHLWAPPKHKITSQPKTTLQNFLISRSPKIFSDNKNIANLRNNKNIANLRNNKNIANLRKCLESTPIIKVADIINEHVNWPLIPKPGIKALLENGVNSLYSLKRFKNWEKLPFSEYRKSEIQKCVLKMGNGFRVDDESPFDFMQKYRKNGLDKSDSRIVDLTFDVKALSDEELLRSFELGYPIRRELDREETFNLMKRRFEKIETISKPHIAKIENEKEKVDEDGFIKRRNILIEDESD